MRIYWGIFAVELNWNHASAWVIPYKFSVFWQNSFSEEQLSRAKSGHLHYSKKHIWSFQFINPNLGGGLFYSPPSWFSLNNSRTVKALTLEFCSIQYPSIRDITCPSLQILGKTQTGVFPISGFLVNPL